MTKTITSLFVGFSLLFTVVAFADLNPVSVVVNSNNDVNTGESTTAVITATRDSGDGPNDGNNSSDGADDNWLTTSYRIGNSGNFTCVSQPTPDLTTFSGGSDTNSTSISFTAPASAGTYTLNVRLYNDANCDGGDNDGDEAQASASDSFTVVAPAPTDNDEDGVPNETDNCPAVSNADQADFDNDGIGNVCDESTDYCADVEGVQSEEDPCPTPQEQCETAEGFWNGENCEEIPSCGEGTVYNSETNDCDPVVPPTPAEQCELDGGVWDGESCACPEGETGTPPSCSEIPDNNGGGNDDNNEENNDGGHVTTSGGYGYCDIADLPVGDQHKCRVRGGGLVYTNEYFRNCSALITKYLRLGNNDTQVTLLKGFLNKELAVNIGVSSNFDLVTELAVKVFQLKYWQDVLQPWGITDATGIVYKSTLWKINDLNCASLNTPFPVLP